jgi:hypothetical protein
VPKAQLRIAFAIRKHTKEVEGQTTMSMPKAQQRIAFAVRKHTKEAEGQTTMPVSKAQLRSEFATRPKRMARKPAALQAQTAAAPYVTEVFLRAQENADADASEIGRNFPKERVRHYEKELAEFEQEIEKMSGYGYPADGFSGADRLKQGRSLNEQRCEEAQRQVQIREAKTRWETQKEVDLRRCFGCNEAEVQEILTMDPKYAPYYWSQYLDWTTCLRNLSPPAPRQPSQRRRRQERW